jgi:NADH dehydrogenase
VLPLGAAGARFQPIWVDDVARAFVAALGDPRTFGETYCLCGPQIYTLEALARVAGRAFGHERAIVPLPAPLARLQAFVLEHLPGRLLTRDNLLSMSVESVCPSPFPAIFGFRPAPLEGVLEGYLAGSASRARYPRLRHRAGK